MPNEKKTKAKIRLCMRPARRIERYAWAGTATSTTFTLGETEVVGVEHVRFFRSPTERISQSSSSR
jgi:hypothetical protein